MHGGVGSIPRTPIPDHSTPQAPLIVHHGQEHSERPACLGSDATTYSLCDLGKLLYPSGLPFPFLEEIVVATE